MPKTPRQTTRRADALTKMKVVHAAIEILDAGGEAALTFRTLATRLATGSGALYWHVADRNTLLTDATADVLARTLSDLPKVDEPAPAIRAVALAVFDAIDAHPWVGSHLSQEPWHRAIGEIFERIGEQLEPLGVAADAEFDCASALTSYILGTASQNAINATRHPGGVDRETFLESVAERWIQDNPGRRPFIRRVAAQLRDHEDRRQFLAGIDLILSGACLR
ncbi:TetR/AcrR family transcriptional regulator [Xanthobacter sp.]|uniref:TetR/AcrR family transcriptional regulator n=1 Tax=Xanthobacter sp. TaxID=35809 RepID=UPI0035AE242B